MAGFPPLAKGPLGYEWAFWDYGLRVAGVDEAGRGPLAGPVVAGAVVLSGEEPIEGVDDSKRLTPAQREKCFRRILDRAEATAAGAASVREIDSRNIVGATARAMARAIAKLRLTGPFHVVVDGLWVRTLGVPHDAVVGGDALVHSVACASIVAKVTRDRLMRRLARRFPGYGWSRNMGYGTPEHRAALAKLGPTPHHRLSFLPSQLELRLDDRAADCAAVRSSARPLGAIFPVAR